MEKALHGAEGELRMRQRVARGGGSEDGGGRVAARARPLRRRRHLHGLHLDAAGEVLLLLMLPPGDHVGRSAAVRQ